MSNSLNLDETLRLLGVSSRSKLFAYGTLVMTGGQRVKQLVTCATVLAVFVLLGVEDEDNC